MKNALNWLQNAISSIRFHDAAIAKSESAILELLLEIESKKAYSSLGFDGLYSFCIKTFGWSESQTATRTQAMYALRSVPELKEKIDQGVLSVTTIAQVERYLRQEQVEAGVKPTPEQKREIFESFENKTSIEVKLEIAERRGERIKTRLALELDEEAEALWNQVRNLSAHQTQGSALNCLKVLMKSYVQVCSKKVGQSGLSNPPQQEVPSNAQEVPVGSDLAHEGIADSKTVDAKTVNAKALDAKAADAKTVDAHRVDGHRTNARRTTSSLTKPAGTAPTTPTTKTRPSPSPRFIPAATRRAIFRRDQHRCRNCGSGHALQIDHIRPVAKGGGSEPENLRLLCRNCNLGRAIETFGRERMSA